MKRLLTTAALVSAVLIGSPADAKKKPELMPMELQALQSREYQTTKEQLFSSVVTVFQDLGYQISGADMGSGFISAGSGSKNKTGFFEALGGVHSSGATRATAFVEQMPSGLSRARLNFMSTKNSSSLYGRSSSKDKPILDSTTYQNAFQRVEQALFERGALNKTVAVSQSAVALPAASSPTVVATVPAPVVVPTPK